ncbi:MAG: hypothetical protein MRJ65_12925 [Candidatus Brocadiaceae bacterium]|nr:hypothetical protein [Candidatus Brocadiaceae bacterium]
MIHKKMFGMFVVSVISAITLWAGNTACAGEETFKTSEKHLAKEYRMPETKDIPLCPLCKKTHLGPIKGKTHAPMGMDCPDCKTKISEMNVHHCDLCDKDVMICATCKRKAAELQVQTKEAKCPKCKKVRARHIKGRTFANWEMKCPECKKKSKEWNMHHCDECDIDFLSCPLCEKEK